ncbi:MAG: Gfo/Idh/MocA family oxidoreductase [Chloroflexi bacterium]|nr:Gfo/Idh/MocA family oxidoreductase [Chloroflexota bacterium]MCC6894013.1 Gfo/Idh/MocA family oxidoreductase [Anaerolineae bacterium]
MPRAKRELRFGIIGLGLMGREFGSAAARWAHLLNLSFIPRITAICDTNEKLFEWWDDNFDGIKLRTTNYHDLLGSADVDAIYCAVPHNLHAGFYTDIIRAGKHMLGEKPFGIDAAANAQILEVINQHPDVVVACSSEFPFFPGAQRVIRYINEQRFGKIIEVSAGLLHSSDLDPNKKINWKRMVHMNGEYGCMGDLGMHPLHIPLRAGWMPSNVRALLSNIVTQRPDASGQLVPCETWDNATLACEVQTADQHFPMVIQTYRISPGDTNTWYIRITGTEFSVEYSTKFPKTLRTMEYTSGGEQAWKVVDLGYETAYPTITGGIFEFGFSDGLLQMWAAFCDQLANGRANMMQSYYCATPTETALHHRVLTAALESGKRNQVVNL